MQITINRFNRRDVNACCAELALQSREPLMFTILPGVAVASRWMVSVSAPVVRPSMAEKPREYSWQQPAGAGGFAGVGLTIFKAASQGFPSAADFTASIFSAILGTALLLHAGRNISNGDETSGLIA